MIEGFNVLRLVPLGEIENKFVAGEGRGHAADDGKFLL
jgi:hypothetical protein